MAIDWTEFFQFSKDDTFDILDDDGIIAGNDNINLGSGKVLEIRDNNLVLELNITSQNIEISGFLPNLFGIDSVDVPKVTIKVSITISDLDDAINRLEASGTYIDSNNITQSFNYTDTALKARLKNSGNRLRLDASDEFFSQISDDGNIKDLGRLEFEKTGDSNTTELDIGKLFLIGKVEFFLRRNVTN